MNWAWWDGRVPVEHYRAEHALDLETLLAPGKPLAEKREADEPSTESTDRKSKPAEKQTEP